MKHIRVQNNQPEVFFTKRGTWMKVSSFNIKTKTFNVGGKPYSGEELSELINMVAMFELVEFLTEDLKRCL